MQSSVAPSSAQSDVDNTNDTNGGDVWLELFGIVSGLEQTVDLAMQAFGTSDTVNDFNKVMSTTTKKRLLIKSVQGFKESRAGLGALTNHLRALQVASQQWQRSMLFASKSQEELMDHLEGTSQQLHETSERLRASEAGRIIATRQADALKSKLEESSLEIKTLRAALKQKEDDLETAQFSSAEAQAEASHALERALAAQEAAKGAEERERRAVNALDAAREEAAKATSGHDRHQQVVAKLTADNLMFLMSLKKVQAELQECQQERDQLRLAVEQQRGPWFDQVRAGVEERVKKAMQRADTLEAELQSTMTRHRTENEALIAQRSDLEEYLGSLKASHEALESKLAIAEDAKREAELRLARAVEGEGEARRLAEGLLADKRVLQETLAAMRLECTERWSTEQTALSQVSGLKARISDLERALAEREAAMLGMQRAIESASGVNRQLMQKKEEVEWQLMSMMAGGGGGGGGGGPAFALPPSSTPPPSGQPQHRTLTYHDASNSNNNTASNARNQSPLRQAVEVLPSVPVRSLPPSSPRSLFPPHAPTPSAVAPALIASNFYSSPSQQKPQGQGQGQPPPPPPPPQPQPQPQSQAPSLIAASYYSSPTKAAASSPALGLAPPPPPTHPAPTPPNYNPNPTMTRPFVPTLTPHPHPHPPSYGIITSGAGSTSSGTGAGSTEVQQSPAKAAASYARASSATVDVSPSASRNHQGLYPQVGPVGATEQRLLSQPQTAPPPPSLPPPPSAQSPEAAPKARGGLLNHDNAELWEIRRSGAKPLPAPSGPAPFHPALHPSARVDPTVNITPNPYSS